jgi:hypothetical protein
MKLFIQIFLILTAIFALSYYDYSVHGEQYERQKRERDYWTVGYLNVDSVKSDFFYATNRTDTVIGIDYLNALPEDRMITKGDLISLKGEHISDVTVEVDFIHFHDGRIWKIFISILPVLILGVLFIKLFKYDKKTRRLIKR